MSYAVVVAQALEPRFFEILGRLPEDVVDQVEARLLALGHNHRLARRVKAPLDGLVYSFSCNYGALRYAFLFTLVYGEDEETLVLTDIGFATQQADR